MNMVTIWYLFLMSPGYNVSMSTTMIVHPHEFTSQHTCESAAADYLRRAPHRGEHSPALAWCSSIIVPKDSK